MHYLYKITNMLDGKVYIGQAVDDKHRWRQHVYFAKNPEKTKQYIHRAMNKYGTVNFVFEIIASCRTQEDADVTEIELIKQYDSRNPERGYNLCQGGGGGWFGKKHTPETKAKISAARLGTIPSEESNLKRSQTMKEKCASGWMPKTSFVEGSEATKYWKGKHNTNGFKSGRILDPEVEAKRLANLRAKGAWNKITLSESQSNEVKNLFSKGTSLREMERITGISRHLIKKELKRIGLK